MSHLIKPILSLSILMLLSQPIAHAESNDQALSTNQLQDQVRELQTQMKELNGKVSVLEMAKNNVNPDIQNNKKLKVRSDAVNSDDRRSANGHGR